MTRSERGPAGLATLTAVLIIVVWGVNFSVQKYAFRLLTPAGFLFVRYALQLLCALGLLLYQGGGRLRVPSRADLRALAWLGFVGHVLHIGLSTYGIHWSTAFSSSLIMASGPVTTLLILRWRGVETLTRGQVGGVAVACCGVLVFLWDKLAAGQWAATGGDLVLLAAATFFSYYTVESKPLVHRLGPVPVMCWAMLLGGVPVTLASLPTALTLEWSTLPTALWIAVLWAVLVSAFGGWLAWAWVNATLGVARTAPVLYLMPPVAGLVSWMLGGERFTTENLAGAAVTLTGIAIAQFTAPPGRPEREAPVPVD